MNTDPISQLPEPYRAAWNVLHGAGSLENISKNIIANAMRIANASWGMIVLKSDTSLYYYSYLPVVRTLPDASPETFDRQNVLLAVYLLAHKAMRNERSEVILDIGRVSLQDKENMIKEFFQGRTVISVDEPNDENEDTRSLLFVPILSGRGAVGTIVLRCSSACVPFTTHDVSMVELFAALIAESLSSTTMLSELTNINNHIQSFIIHETHNPLTSIRGYADLLLNMPEHGTLNDEQIEFVKNIRKNGKRLKHILRNFYFLFNVESHQAKVGHGRFDVSEVVLKQYEGLKENFTEKNQNVYLNLGNDILAQGDSRWINYAVEAMMQNACSNSPAGSDVNISIEILDEFVRVSISDHGIGLTDEEKTHLFEKFYRSDRARFEYGTGLDLFIAKHHIEKMGGQIGAEGAPDQGSTFWFMLPTAKE